MRIDPKGTIRGYPTLLVRQTLRCLRGDFVWGEAALERAAKLPPGTGRALARALEAEGLIKASRHDGWTVTKSAILWQLPRRLGRYRGRRRKGRWRSSWSASRE